MYDKSQWCIYFKIKGGGDGYIVRDMPIVIACSRSSQMYSDGIGMMDNDMEAVCKINMGNTIRIAHQIKKQYKPKKKKGWIFGN